MVDAGNGRQKAKGALISKHNWREIYIGVVVRVVMWKSRNAVYEFVGRFLFDHEDSCRPQISPCAF